MKSYSSALGANGLGFFQPALVALLRAVWLGAFRRLSMAAAAAIAIVALPALSAAPDTPPPTQFVAVGQAGTILTSSDGVTWTPRTSGSSARLRGVTANNIQVFVVGEAGTILSSNTTTSWTVRPSGTTETLRGVACNGLNFVAVGGQTAALVRYSTNGGGAWSGADVPTAGKLRAVVWGNNMFVAVGANGTILTSTDGSVWNSQNAETTERLDGIVWTGTKFSVISSTGKVFSSTNAVSWTSEQGNPPSWIEGMAWNSTTYVTVGAGGRIKTSADASSWTFRTSGTTNTLHGVAWVGTAASTTVDPIAAIANLRKITVSGVTATSRTYNATTTAALVTGEAELVGVASGDTVLLGSSSATGAFADKNVGTAKPVTTTGFTISGANAADYTLVQPSPTANITAAGLTVSGVIANDKTYDGNTTAQLTTVNATPVGVLLTDDVAIGGTPAGAFASRTVGTNKTVTTSGFTLTGTDAANYTVTQPSLTAAITVKGLTVTGATVSNKPYDGLTTAVPSLLGVGLSGAVDGDLVSLSSSSAVASFANRNAGANKTVTFSGFSLTGTDSTNYSLTQPTTTASITAKALTVTGVSANNKTYDGTTTATLDTGTAGLSGIVSDDNVSLTGTPVGAFSSRTVGIGKTVTVSGYSLTGSDAANYTVTQPTATAAITAKALTVTGAAANSKAYDGTTTATPNTTGAELTGRVGDDAVSLVSSGATATFASKAIGTAKVVTFAGFSLNGSDSTNYTLTQPTTTADITAKGLTVTGVTANNKTYDGLVAATLNTGSALLSGVATDDVVNLTGTPVGVFGSKTVGVEKTVTVSGYSITGTDAANYTLTQPSPVANITAKTITVSGITAGNKTYDGTTTATPSYTGATLNNLVNGDAVTLVNSGGSATFGNKTVGTNKTVTFAGLTLTGADAANYTLTQPTTTATITAKTLTVTGVTANNKVYDASTTASLNLGSAALVGAVNGDTVTLTTSGATGAFSTAAVGLTKTVQVAGLGLAGADAGNYVLTQPTAAANITPATASISIGNLSQVYDGTPKSVSVSITPAVAAVTVYSNAGGVAPTAAGTYSVSVSITDPNYSGAATASLVVAKASQTVSFPAITGGDFNVGTTLSLGASASSGLPVTYSIVSGSATLIGSSVKITQAGAVTIRATQAGNENYAAATADRSFTGAAVAKRTQTITFPALASHTITDQPFTVSASASSGLPVTFSLVSGPATVTAAGRVTLDGTPGTVTIRASQAGDDTFAAAADATQSFNIPVSLLIAPVIFFGDLVDDSLLSGDGRGELIAASGPRLDAKQGDIAAALFTGTNRGTLLIASSSLGLNASLTFTLAADGTYSISFNGAARALTLTGSYSNGVLTGRIPLLKVAFSTPVQAVTGSTAALAGVYESGSVNNAAGGTSTIVGPNGQILVVATNGSTATGAAGTVNANGTFNLSATGATISGSVDAPTTTVSGTVTVANQAPVSFSGLGSTATRTDRVINLSSRVTIAPAAGRTLITGFVIGGTESKRVLLRGVGPTLAGFGVQGALVNPSLQLFDASGKVLASNDDWSGADVSAAFTQVGAFALTAGSKDAAILTTLAPGAYTMQLTAGSESGIGLAEIYDASANPGAEAQRLVNISTRGSVDVGANGLLIGGFVVTGNTPKKVLIRGVGPTLGGFGVAGTLVDPALAVYSGSTLVAANDNWSVPTPINSQQVAATAAELGAAAQSVGAFGPGAASKDAAVVITLAPGAYTAQVSGVGGATGVALVEVYELP